MQREFAEELGAAIEVRERVGTLEDLSEFNGAAGHEIVLVHRASFRDLAFLEYRRFPLLDVDTETGVWRPLTSATGIPLYPVGLTDLLLCSDAGTSPPR